MEVYSQQEELGAILANLKLVLFGGKGGVGKTTCAAASGVYASKQGVKTLIFSTDPAHSLSDIFGQEIGSRITRIKTIERLYALEMDAKQVLNNFRNRYGKAIEDAAGEALEKAGLPFEKGIMQDAMKLYPPGLDELMALTKLNDIIKEQKFDLIIIDTAASVNTLRLLELSHIIEQWIRGIITIAYKYSNLVSLDATVSLLEDLEREVITLRNTLTDKKRTTFVLVTTPETMSTAVTEDMINSLRAALIPHHIIVVNFLVPLNEKCSYCTARRNRQTNILKQLQNRFTECKLIQTPAFPEEIEGLRLLNDFSAALVKGQAKPAVPHTRKTIVSISLLPAKRLDLSKPSLQLLIFGGKGGCGKTTISAAVAIQMAIQGRRTLVVSTDPQKSLSDIFDQELGSEVEAVDKIPNLHALEIDSNKLLSDFKDQHREEILEIVATATYLDREDVAQLLDFSLPGVDELMALKKVADIVKENLCDLLILDTAPTGHTLRMLELPETLSSWADILLRMRAKTRYIAERLIHIRVREKTDVFVDQLVKDIRTIRTLLRNPEKTGFIAVTTLDKLAVNETESLIANLASQSIPSRRIIVNQIIPANEKCGYCTSKLEQQKEILSEVREKFSNLEIIGVPLFPNEITGIGELKKLGESSIERWP